MKSLIAIISTLACLAITVVQTTPVLAYNTLSSPGFALPPPVVFSGFNTAPGIISAPVQTDYTHPAVVENAIAESQLPSELLNPFYKNPAIASGLAKESWFGNKEFPVHHREAEKIPRQRIFDIIKRLEH